MALRSMVPRGHKPLVACLAAGALAAASGAAAACGGAPHRPPGDAVPSRWPTPATAGVPAGWTPAHVRTTDLVVTRPRAVVHDIRLDDADLVVDAPDVTIRRVLLRGGRIQNRPGSACRNGLVIEDTTIAPPPGRRSSVESEGVVSYGGYTARRVKIWRRSEGFRAGGRSAGCGPVRIEDSFAKIVIPPGHCDEHADGIQGYDGPPLTVVDTTIDFTEASCGTAPFFVPEGQGNTTATVDGLLVMGGGFSFRDGVPGSVRGLRIADGAWGYGPVDVNCSLLREWEARVVALTRDYRTARAVRRQPCR